MPHYSHGHPRMDKEKPWDARITADATRFLMFEDFFFPKYWTQFSFLANI